MQMLVLKIVNPNTL